MPPQLHIWEVILCSSGSEQQLQGWWPPKPTRETPGTREHMCWWGRKYTEDFKEMIIMCMCLLGNQWICMWTIVYKQEPFMYSAWAIFWWKYPLAHLASNKECLLLNATLVLRSFIVWIFGNNFLSCLSFVFCLIHHWSYQAEFPWQQTVRSERKY